MDMPIVQVQVVLSICARELITMETYLQLKVIYVVCTETATSTLMNEVGFDQSYSCITRQNDKEKVIC